jgi:hypothetical protein
MITENHCTSWPVHAKYFLENTFATCLTLSVHMKTTEVFGRLQKSSTLFAYLQKVHTHCLVRELLLAWEDSCKPSTVIIKVMDIRNITWMVDFAFIPVRIKYMLFVCKDTPDVQLLTELWGGYSFFHTYMPNSGKYSSQGIYLIGNEHYMNLYLCLCYYKL